MRLGITIPNATTVTIATKTCIDKTMDMVTNGMLDKSFRKTYIPSNISRLRLVLTYDVVLQTRTRRNVTTE